MAQFTAGSATKKGLFMTTLEFFLDTFGWQGGTIHQVSEELERAGLPRNEVTATALIGLTDWQRQVVRELYWMKTGKFRLDA